MNNAAKAKLVTEAIRQLAVENELSVVAIVQSSGNSTAIVWENAGAGRALDYLNGALVSVRKIVTEELEAKK